MCQFFGLILSNQQPSFLLGIVRFRAWAFVVRFSLPQNFRKSSKMIAKVIIVAKWVFTSLAIFWNVQESWRGHIPAHTMRASWKFEQGASSFSISLRRRRIKTWFICSFAPQTHDARRSCARAHFSAMHTSNKRAKEKKLCESVS